jgi:hypothetical protein
MPTVSLVKPPLFGLRGRLPDSLPVTCEDFRQVLFRFDFFGRILGVVSTPPFRRSQMPEPFDPYYKWLGIPPAQQPPHHYRLLGIELFESDVEVIDMAANQRMSYLQEMAGGPNGKDSQRLLNEVSAARRCLLDKSAKTAYDEQLRAKSPKPATVVVESGPAGPDDDTINVSPTVNITVGKTSAKGAKSPSVGPIGPIAPVVAPAAGGAPSFNFEVNDTASGKPGKTTAGTAKPTPSKSKTPSTKTKAPAAAAGASGESQAGKPQSGKSNRKKSRLLPIALGLLACAGAAGGGFEFYRRSQASKDDSSVALAPTAAASAGTAPTSTPDPAATAPSPTASPAPSASPDASAAVALEMFNSALKTSQSPGELLNTTGGGAATTKPSKNNPTNSAIVAAAEAGPPPEQMFLKAAASSNAAAPGIHLQPSRNLLGRPIGFFKSDSEYHLFYESVALPRRPGSDFWGHCVSTDLLSWRELPLTVAPDPKRLPRVGSIFVDADNAAGLGEAGKPVWLAACTFPGADKKAEIGYASSSDQGATWTFAPAPVLKGLAADVGPPRIVRDAERKQWCLVALTQASKDTAKYAIYTSPDLKTWTKKHDISLTGGAGPADFFEIREGASGKARRWIFAGGNGRYMLGRFDGEQFTTDNAGGQLFGAGYGWCRTIDDSPGEPRRVALSILAAPPVAKQPPYGTAVAIPLEYSLFGGEAAPALAIADAREVNALAGKAINLPAADLPAGAPISILDCGPTYRFRVVAEPGKADALDVVLFGEKIRFDFKAKTVTFGTTTLPYEAASADVSGIVDRDVAEFRVPGRVPGRVAMSTRSGPGVTPFRLDAVGGTARLQSAQVVPLVRSAGKP